MPIIKDRVVSDSQHKKTVIPNSPNRLHLFTQGYKQVDSIQTINVGLLQEIGDFILTEAGEILSVENV